MKKNELKENISFEDYLVKLEDIVKKLEEGELSLDESVKLYEEGMSISKLCLKKLESTKKKIEKLVIKDDDEYSLENFKLNDKENLNEF
jgi:exodeoxyribonuclease VII small subunit